MSSFAVPGQPGSPIRRALLVTLGCLCVGVGTVGVFVPGLPTTVFLLGASALFAGSSPRLHRWIEEHRWFGPYLKMARERRMPVRAKVVSLLAMWAGIAWACVATSDLGWFVPASIVFAGLVGTLVIIFFVRNARTSLPVARARF